MNVPWKFMAQQKGQECQQGHKGAPGNALNT